MRIAFLSWRDTTHPDGGGSEVYVETVGRELAARGHEVTLVCARHGHAPADEVRDGVRIHRVGGRLSVYPRGLLWVLRHRRRVDVVVDVVNGVPFATPLVRRSGVVALVHHVHREQWRIIYPGWPSRLGWLLESRVVPRLYRRHPWLTVSRSSARDLVGLGVPPERLSIARNGHEGPRLDGPESPTPLLCVLARLVPHKRIEHAFRVLAALAPEHPDLRLAVIGEGWWHDRLVEDATALGVADRVDLHGHVPVEVRDALLREAWLMLLPSAKEGWGLAVTEAAAQETPTVAYRAAGGVTESVRDGETGVLVDDLDELVAVTRRLLGDEQERRALGRAARSATDGLTWQASADEVERVLRDAARVGQEP